MIDSLKIEKVDSTYQYGLEESILIIGEGSHKEIGKIRKYKDLVKIKSIHGTSQLTQAFKEAKEFGVEEIYVLNVKSISDYINIANTLMQYEFTYIVPLSIKYSDTFINKLTGKKSNFINEYINTVSEYSKSIFIFTDEHASLYEDIDHFLIDQNRKIERAKEFITTDKNKEQFVCVLNHLKNYQYANLVLACILATTKIGTYPKDKDIGEAIFYLNDFDVSYDLVYFRNNIHVKTSVENLVNLKDERDVYKSVNIQRVINYIKRNLDLSEYESKLYDSRVKIRVHNDTRDFFTQLVGNIIRDFEINNIFFKKIAPSTGILIIEVTILPINSVNKVPIKLEV